MIVHLGIVIPLILVGLFGFSIRRSAIGALVSFLILWQGILAFAAIIVFQQKLPKEGPVLVWVLAFMHYPALIAILVLSLRQYYLKRTISWEENEEIRR